MPLITCNCALSPVVDARGFSFKGCAILHFDKLKDGDSILDPSNLFYC